MWSSTNLFSKYLYMHVECDLGCAFRFTLTIKIQNSFCKTECAMLNVFLTPNTWNANKYYEEIHIIFSLSKFLF